MTSNNLGTFLKLRNELFHIYDGYYTFNSCKYEVCIELLICPQPIKPQMQLTKLRSTALDHTSLHSSGFWFLLPRFCLSIATSLQSDDNFEARTPSLAYSAALSLSLSLSLSLAVPISILTIHR